MDVRYQPYRKIVALLVFLVIRSIGIGQEMPDNNSTSERPKNIIFLIGDGMGLPHISATIYENRKTSFELFKNIGLLKTHCSDNLITDSAAGGTAMATGHKTFRNAIGMNADTLPVKSILNYAKDHNLKTGIVTNSSIVHATPASFYAHQPFRALTEPIATDLRQADIDFVLGGGLKYFDEGRSDGISILPELKSSGYNIYDYKSYSLQNFPLNREKKLLYFSSEGEPSLPRIGQEYLSVATKRALEYLDQDQSPGFFLMIEAAQIDWAGHGRDEEAMIVRMEYFNDLLKELVRFVQKDKETLLVVTADHSTGELGFLPKARIGDVAVIFNSNDHTASMVPVFAMGPAATRFKGIYDNTDLFFKMMSIMKWSYEQ